MAQAAQQLGALNEAAIDHSKDPEKFREDLINIAKTTLSSKVLSQDKELFAEIAVTWEMEYPPPPYEFLLMRLYINLFTRQGRNLQPRWSSY